MANVPGIPPEIAEALQDPLIWSQFFGPHVAGIVGGTFLAGILVVQAYDYQRVFPHDQPIYKFLVALLLALNAVCLVIDWYTIYLHAAVQAPAGLLDPIFNQYDTAQLVSGPLFSAIIACIAQIFFAYRAKFFVPRVIVWPWLLLVGACMIVGLFGGFGICIGASMPVYDDPYNSLPPESLGTFVNASTYMWLWGDAAADVLITATLCVCLWKSRNDGFQRTRNLVMRILDIAIACCALTTVTAITSAIFYVETVAWTEAYTSFSYALPRLYAISVLFTLNSRVETNNILAQPTTNLMTDSELSSGKRSWFSFGKKGSNRSGATSSGAKISLPRSAGQDERNFNPISTLRFDQFAVSKLEKVDEKDHSYPPSHETA